MDRSDGSRDYRGGEKGGLYSGRRKASGAAECWATIWSQGRQSNGWDDAGCLRIRTSEDQGEEFLLFASQKVEPEYASSIPMQQGILRRRRIEYLR